MARRHYDVLVGLFAAAAIAVLAFMAMQFSGTHKYRKNVVTVIGQFNRTGGLIEKAPVYYSGVECGIVDKIVVAERTGKIHVHMRVSEDAKLRATDVPEIYQRGMLGDMAVNFIRGEERGPVARDNHKFVGKDPVDIVRKAEELLRQMTSEETVSSVRTILHNIEQLTGEETQEFLRETARNVSELTGLMREEIQSLREFFSPELRDDVRTIIAKARAASEDLPELTHEGTLILRDTRAHIIRIAQDLTKNADRIDAILDSTADILAATARGEGTVGQLAKDPKLYNATVATLDELRESIRAIRYYGPIWGRRVREAEAAEAQEAAQRAQIWRR